VERQAAQTLGYCVSVWFYTGFGNEGNVGNGVPVQQLPNVVESDENPQTIWQWDHSNIPPEIDKHFISDKPYWLQVIHSQNLINRIPVDDPRKIIHRQLKPKLEFLAYFGIDINWLPDA